MALDSPAAFILTGGKSTRMGSDKASLLLGGKTLLQRARDKARTVCASVSTVGSQAQFGPDAIEDIFPGSGPLAGIHAALRSSHSELNLLLAVDIPFVETRFLEYLLREARLSSAAVTVPRAGGGWQPLCAVYRPDFVDVAESALEAGQCKIDALFNRVQLRIVDTEELARFDFSASMFDNLNTPEDLARAEERAAAAK